MPLTPAEKQHRYRERMKRGATSVRINADPEFVDALIDQGLLRAWDSEDTEALKAAVEDLHRAWTESVTG